MIKAPASFEVATTILQENIVYELDCAIKVTWNIAQHPLHHVTYATPKLEVATFKLWVDAFTREYSI